MAKSSRQRPLPKRVYESRLPALREELIQLQVSLQSAAFPILLIIAGDDAAGKGEVVNLLNSWLDPRGVETFAFHDLSDEERERPLMWRYWRSLPLRGRIAIYAGGWHADALEQNPVSRRELALFAETLRHMRHFEGLLADDGALIIKVWLQLSSEDQAQRLHDLEDDPATAWRVSADDWKNHREYATRSRLSAQMRRATHRPNTPWNIIEASDLRSRNLAVAELLLTRVHAHQQARAPQRHHPHPRPIVPLHPSGRQRLRALPLDQDLSESAYQAKRDKWLGRLNHAVRAAAEQGRSIVWVFEGWDAAGKGGAIRRLTSAIDARDYRVIPIAKPTDEEKAHHYLWRFWRHVPRAGRVTIYDRSWYGRVLVERIEGFCASSEWRRAYDELNEFETQLTNHGIIVLKFWLHLSPQEQLRRFRHRETTTYKRHKINDEDWRNRRQWRAYEIAVGDMLALTHRPDAPWHLIPADNKRFARLEILKRSCNQITAALRA